MYLTLTEALKRVCHINERYERVCHVPDVDRRCMKGDSSTYGETSHGHTLIKK